MSVNSVFYAESYHPIQAGSIDGTDILPHDNAIYRAHLCSEARLYEPFGDTNVTGDPYCTVFVGHLSHLTTEDTLRKAMSKYGQVKNVRLVRHIVTGASRGYAFVEFTSEREMRRAYKDAHHSMIDDYEIMVDYNRQQLMPGWIPRRLGGGLGGKKESGQLRFGGRERPFRAPLRPIPHDDLKKLGIPAPPEGRYMSRFQVPSPPRKSSTAREEGSHRRRLMDREENTRRRESLDLEEHSPGRTSKERGERSSADRNRSREREERHSRRRIRDKEEQSRERSYTHDDESPPRRKRSRERPTREEPYSKRSSRDKEEQPREESYRNEEEPNASRRKRSRDKEGRSHERSSRDKEKSSHRRDRDQEERSHRRQKHSSKSHRHDKSGSQDQFYDD